MSHSVFITGSTGYMGSRLIPLLVKRGHAIKALVRKGSETKLSPGASGVIGDALQMDSYTEHVRGADTFVHLIGVPHPSPAKAAQFREVDLVSAPGCNQGGARCRRSPFCLFERGTSGAGDGGVYRSANERRGDGARSWNSSDFLAPLVCAWTRPLVALLVGAGLLDH